MFNMIEELKIKSKKELFDTLSSSLRSNQFEISENQKGFDVKLTYIPKNLKVPSQISYFPVAIRKVKKI